MATRLLTAAILALLLAPAAARADAPNPSFYLVNRAGQAINQVFVSPVAASGWGRDQLGDNTLDAGNYIPIRLHADGNCMFDLRIIYQDGRNEERRSVNTCAADAITFTDSRGNDSRGRPPPAAAVDTTRDPTFRVINNSARDINELYLRIAGTNNWGRDRLGDDTVDAGESKVINLPQGQCVWDLRFVFEGGRSQERRRIDLCKLTDLPVQ